MATGTIGKATGTETTEAIVTAEARTEGAGTTATGMTEVPEKTGTRAGVAAMTGAISVTAPTTKIDTSEVTSTEVTVTETEGSPMTGTDTTAASTRGKAMATKEGQTVVAMTEEAAEATTEADAEASEEKAEVDSAAGLKAGQATTDQARL